MTKDLKSIYTASTKVEAELALTNFNDKWNQKYPHITQSWHSNWFESSCFRDVYGFSKTTK